MVMALIAFDERPAWITALVYVTVIVTVLSGADYFFGLRRRLSDAGAAAADAPPAGADLNGGARP